MSGTEKKIIKILNDHGKMLKEHRKSLDKIEKLLSNKSELISKSSEKTKSSKSKSSKSISIFIKGFADEGFFDTPKTIKEISEELARNGYHYRTTSLTNPLRTLLRKRSIGRIIVNGQWAYVKR